MAPAHRLSGRAFAQNDRVCAVSRGSVDPSEVAQIDGYRASRAGPGMHGYPRLMTCRMRTISPLMCAVL